MIVNDSIKRCNVIIYISLYCHSNNEGLRALEHFFNQRTVKEPSSETLHRLAELVLTLNCFSIALPPLPERNSLNL